MDEGENKKLINACANSHLDIVKKLIENKANVNVEGVKKDTINICL